MLSVLAFMLFLQVTSAIYKTMEFSSSQLWATTVVSNFAMARGGTIDIEYDVSAKDNSTSTRSYVLIVIVDEPSKEGWYKTMPNVGDYSTNEKKVSSLCNYPSLYRNVVYGKGTVNYVLQNHSKSGDRYYVFAFQCVESGNQTNPITTQIEVSMMNVRPGVDGELSHIKTHLPINRVFSIRMYEGLIILHYFFLLGLLVQLYLGFNYPPGLHRVHYMFVISELSYIASLFSTYWLFYQYGDHGTITYEDNIGPYVIDHISTFIILLTMMFVSVGYDIFRSNVSDREFQLISMGFTAYFINGFFKANCNAYKDSNSNADYVNGSICNGAYSMDYLLHTAIFLGSILGMNYNVTALRVHTHGSPWTQSTALSYARAKQFMMYRYVYLLFLVLPLIITIFETYVLNWRQDWISSLMYELTTMMIFVHVVITFGPIRPAQFSRAFDGSIAGTQGPMHEE